MNKKRKILRMIYIPLLVLVVLVLGVCAFLNQKSFGKTPDGEKIARIKNSPNYREGQFHNTSPTQQITSNKSKMGTMMDFLFRDSNGLRPENDLPSVKTDLNQFSRDQEVLVWLGHSSLFIQTAGKRILIDPVFICASPVSFFNKPFKGTELYTPDDMPDIDYLVITHDHWDHLDYDTVEAMKDRIGKIICPLGVGEHFRYWGFTEAPITELDWNETVALDSEINIHCLPARHFSGRGLSPNKTLWASYMIQTPSKKIYIGGDTGYDTHFQSIRKQFGTIDLAILENGQYDNDWKYIHLLPEDLIQAAKDLNAKRILTVHNSKYALGKHTWKAPLENISQAAEQDSLPLATPTIGEIMYLDDSTQTFRKWWEEV